jgi:microcystin-dependent protein
VPATLNGFPCIDPRQLERDLRAQGAPAPWYGRANGYVCPTGFRSGRGCVLVLRRDLDLINTNAAVALTISDGAGGTVTFPQLFVLTAECASPGADGDPAAAYACELVDRREYLNRYGGFINAGYNLRLLDGSDYDQSTINGGVPFTWQQIVSALWSAAGLNGSATLPFTPDGVPENFAFHAMSAYKALEHLLSRLACTLVYDARANTFSVARLGSVSDNPNEDGAGAAPKIWEEDPRDTLTRLPPTVYVRFPYYPEPNTDFQGLWHVETVDGEPSGQGAAVTIDDEMAAVAPPGETPENLSEIITRAEERADDFLRANRRAGARKTRSWAGVVSGVYARLGPHWSAAAVLDPGTGVRTELAAGVDYRPPPMWRRPGAGSLTVCRVPTGFTELIQTVRQLQNLINALTNTSIFTTALQSNLTSLTSQVPTQTATLVGQGFLPAPAAAEINGFANTLENTVSGTPTGGTLDNTQLNSLQNGVGDLASSLQNNLADVLTNPEETPQCYTPITAIRFVEGAGTTVGVFPDEDDPTKVDVIISSIDGSDGGRLDVCAPLEGGGTTSAPMGLRIGRGENPYSVLWHGSLGDIDGSCGSGGSDGSCGCNGVMWTDTPEARIITGRERVVVGHPDVAAPSELTFVAGAGAADPEAEIGIQGPEGGPETDYVLRLPYQDPADLSEGDLLAVESVDGAFIQLRWLTTDDMTACTMVENVCGELGSGGGGSIDCSAFEDSADIVWSCGGAPVEVSALLTATGVVAGTYGGTAAQTVAFTTDSKGRITAAAQAAIAIAASQVTSGVFPEDRGGTNQSAYTTGDLLYASAADTLSKRAIGSTGDVLTVSGGVPTWAAPAAGVPTGAILPYGASSAPDGYLNCDGSAVSRTTYADLFAVIGVQFGTGNGSTTFNLPDLRGRVPMGVDGSANRVNSLSTGGANADTLGGAGGSQTHQLGPTESGVPQHTHGIAFDATNRVQAGTDFLTFGSAANVQCGANAAASAANAHSNTQPWLALNYIIKT